MKSFILLSFLAASSAWAMTPPHLDLEMTTYEYQKLNRRLNTNKSFQSDGPEIDQAIILGERLSQWIKIINNTRRPQDAIRLTSAANRRGIPIDQPNAYSPSIIAKDTRSALSQMPLSMREVLESSDALPGTIGIKDEEFITHARKIDRNYQSAVRFKALKPHLSYYIEQSARDVRGYYYIMKNSITAADLEDISKIPNSKAEQLKEALVKVCHNSYESSSKCSKALRSAWSYNKVAKFFQEYFPKAQDNWRRFFNIPTYAVREDITWSDATTYVPFNTPEIQRYRPYLRDNIQDEFRWGGWSLRLQFGTYPKGPRLKFVPGEVPHVNELGGNEIVMDANQPIEEYESQWTIRHEFGHVLGLPDCYHEFYDRKLQAFVNYQLDTSDLMCSRAGNMNKRIYEELRRAYTNRNF